MRSTCTTTPRMDVTASFSSSSSDEDVLHVVVSAVDAVTQSGQASSGWSGSSSSRSRNIRRGECSWWRDYLCPVPLYPPWLFRRRFRVPLKLFRRLLHDLPSVEPELQQKVDAVGRRGATSWQKILNSLRRLGDGASYQSLDDQCRMSVESQRTAFKAFLKAVRACYGSEFLNRRPSLQELRTMERDFSGKHLPGCIGSVDCMSIPKGVERTISQSQERKIGKCGCRGYVRRGSLLLACVLWTTGY